MRLRPSDRGLWWIGFSSLMISVALTVVYALNVFCLDPPEAEMLLGLIVTPLASVLAIYTKVGRIQGRLGL